MLFPRLPARLRNVPSVLWIVLAGILFVVAWTLYSWRGDVEPNAASDPLASIGIAVSQGAAPGYVADSVCSTCHADLFTTYQEVGMSRSFVRAEPKHFIEDFEAPAYFHAPSQRYYEMRLRGDRIVFQRYQLDPDGQPINAFEEEVDWIVGSGNATRSYLYQTDAGELYQLPIGWYTQTGRWRMAPGFDKADHEGPQRQVRRECMFCHNAYPQVPEGAGERWQPHRYPKQLPEGIGCQRCHGPGADHVRTVLHGGRSLDSIRSSVVNPARLEPERRDAVCNQCHLLPAVALIGPRRFSRADYSFRPGEALTEYMLHVDIEEADLDKAERFEINHHAYRLRRSACFQKSDDRLTCTTCHDPHRKVPAAERVSHYAQACLGCHVAHESIASPIDAAADDCIACHMPRRRTQDVVHVVMTDHNIQLRAAPSDARLAPLEETTHTLEAIDFYMPESSPSGPLGEVYKTVAALRARATPDLVDRLEQMLLESQADDTTPYFDLAQGQLTLGRYAGAERILDFLVERHPDHPMVFQWMGVAYMGQGRYEEAQAALDRALQHIPDMAEFHVNLGLLNVRRTRFEAAISHFRQAVAARPNLSVAWLYLADVTAHLERFDEAAGQYRRALEINPTLTRAYLGLARTLSRTGELEKAVRYLEHGRRVAAHPEQLADIDVSTL